MQRPELVSTEAQLAHSTRKLNNAIKYKQGLSKNETLLQTKVTSLQQELASVTKAAERAQGALSLSRWSLFLYSPLTGILEEHQRTSGRNVALSEKSLEEYRQL
jgi:structural maintenance of chromosome 1